MSHRTSPLPQPARTRRGPRALAAVVGAASLLLAAGCASSSSAATGDAGTAEAALTDIRIGIPWDGAAGKEPTDSGPIGYAVHLDLAADILAKHDLALGGFVGFSNGPPVAQALQTDEIQVGLIGDVPAATARASGFELPALYISRPSSDIWVLGRPGGPASLEDLAGGSVGLKYGSNFDKFGRAALKQLGILDDVELVNLGFPDALQALRRGDIDAVPLPATTAGKWLAENDFTILSKASEDTPDLLSAGVALASPQIVKDRPGIGDAIWEVYRAGADAIESDPEKYAAWVEEATGTPAAILLETSLFEYGTEPADPEGLEAVQSTLDFLLDSGAVTDSFDVTSWVLP